MVIELAAAHRALLGIDADSLSDDELVEVVVEARRWIEALTAAAAALAAAADERGAARRAGAASTAQLLVRDVGIGTGRARAELALGRLAARRADVAAAAARGAFTADHAVVVASAASSSAFDEHADELVASAEGRSPAALRHELEAWRVRHTPADADAADAARRARRSLRWSTEADGSTRLSAVLTSEAGDQVRATLEALAEAQRDDGSGRTGEQRLADALADLCAAWAAGQVRGGRQGAQVLVTVDLEVLERRTGRAHTASGATVGPEALRRLCCQAGVHRVITDGPSTVLDLGREVRTATPDQHRALVVRDGGCVAPGCDRPPGWCQAHHWRRHWADGGRTDLDDLALLCHAHHHLVHDDGWQLRRSARGWSLLRPDGHEVHERALPAMASA